MRFQTGTTLNRLEQRHGRSVVGVLKYNGDRLSDPQVVGIAADDIGQHGRSFGERHMGYDIRLFDAAHDAKGVDGSSTRGLAPFHFVTGTEWADGARIPVRAVARGACRDQEAALAGRIEKSLALGGDDRRSEFAAREHGHRVAPVP